LESLDWEAVDALYRAMEGRGRAMLTDAGVDPAEITSVRRAEMRLAGQFHDIAVPVPGGRLTAQAAPGLGERFESEYRRLYGIYLPGRQIQVLNWRVLVTGPRPGVRLAAASVDRGDCAVHALRVRRPAYFPESEGFAEVPVYDRYRLRPGAALTGPAIVEEREATTVVGPGDALEVDAHHNLVIAVSQA
jgi:N-methylhydantoinase A/oxoprolinase/acetone carboxylase beta subunit